MKYIPRIILIILELLTLPLSAQTIDTSINLGIPVEEAPLLIDPPSGYIFFDGEKTRNILTESFENDPSEVVDVVGMLVPDSLSSLAYLNSAWLIEYKKVGHVNDKRADKMGFSWLLDEIIRSRKSRGTKTYWLWDPSYDTDMHSLTLPLLEVRADDERLRESSVQLALFGKDGVTYIQHFSDIDNTKTLQKSAETIKNSIKYTEGNRYEDFDESTDKYTYNSVSSFLKGAPIQNNDSVSSEEETGHSASFFFLPTFIIKGIGIVAGILIFLMLIFMAIVALTNKKEEGSHDISRLGFNVLMRICVFAMVYLLLLVAAVFLIWLGIELTVLIFSHVFSPYLLFAAFGVWALIGGFGYAIIRSLFQLSKSESKDRIEICESDAPKLFSIIKHTAESAGEKMPKHVYVSPDANACVFYDRPVLSLFMPGRKNLQLGLALPYGLSIEELKSILAHEYGHFGQGSMRIGKIVATSYNIAYNIVNAQAFTSHAKLALLTRPLLNKVFGYVQRGYLQLSRAMEYEADEASAKACGSDITISALCKSEVIMERFAGYNNIVAGLYKTDNILPSSYWKGWQMYAELAKAYDGVILHANIKASGPLTTEQASLVKLKDVWTSHPSQRDRINNIKDIPTAPCSLVIEPTEGLVSEKVYEQLSELYFELTGRSGEAERDDDKYWKLLKKEMGERMFSASMRPYFDRHIMFFDINEVANENQDQGIENPISETNREKMEEFSRMITDYQTLMAFKDGAIDEKEIQYDGKVYSRKNAPAEKLLGYLRATENDIIALDKAIARFVLTKASDRDAILKAYDDLFYSYAVISHIEEKIIPARNQVASQLGSGGNVDEQQFKRVQQILVNLRNGLREFVGTLDMSRIEPVLFTDSANHLETLNDDWLCDGVSIGGDESGYVLGLPEFIIGIFKSLIFFSKKKISDTLEGKPITYFWNGTIGATKAMEQTSIIESSK